MVLGGETQCSVLHRQCTNGCPRVSRWSSIEAFDLSPWHRGKSEPGPLIRNICPRLVTHTAGLWKRKIQSTGLAVLRVVLGVVLAPGRVGNRDPRLPEGHRNEIGRYFIRAVDVHALLLAGATLFPQSMRLVDTLHTCQCPTPFQCPTPAAALRAIGGHALSLGCMLRSF
jgi:hypothetical protein